MKPLYIDFEYNTSENRVLNLVCASWKVGKDTRSVWLHNDPIMTRKLGNYIEERKTTHRIICFGGLAEARALLSLGLNPLDIHFIDLWILWRQMQNCRDRWKYGTYFQLGEKRKSVPPHPNKKMNVGKDCREIGGGYADAVGAILGIDIGVSVKDSMRNLILENRSNYSMGERAKIMRYCESDIVHLRPLFQAMVEDLVSATRRPMGEILRVAEELSADVVSMAVCEAEGYPVDVPRLTNLVKNTELVKRDAIEECVASYPFYVRNKHGEWVEKYSQLALHPSGQRRMQGVMLAMRKPWTTMRASRRLLR